MSMRLPNTWISLLFAVLVIAPLPETSWATANSPEFIGLFTHTRVRQPLAEQPDRMRSVLEKNPYIKGMSVRPTWQEIEPEHGRMRWEALDRMISIARARNVYFTLEPIATMFTPAWVYARGAKAFETREINPHRQNYGDEIRFPVPWDSVYRRYWRRFIEALAERYGNDPLLLHVTIHGHNQRLEMHMPRRPEDMDHWRQIGWSVDMVERDWKDWIDFFAATFPRTKLALMLSPMYGNVTNDLVERLVSYATERYAKRMILMTAVLAGRKDQRDNFQISVILRHPEVLNAQETVSSFTQDPRRQGKLELFVYNMRQLSPWYIRLWQSDSQDAKLSAQLLSEYARAQRLTLAAYRDELEARGLYTTTDRYRPFGRGGQRSGQSNGRGGRRRSERY